MSRSDGRAEGADHARGVEAELAGLPLVRRLTEPALELDAFDQSGEHVVAADIEHFGEREHDRQRRRQRMVRRAPHRLEIQDVHGGAVDGCCHDGAAFGAEPEQCCLGRRALRTMVLGQNGDGRLPAAGDGDREPIEHQSGRSSLGVWADLCWSGFDDLLAQLRSHTHHRQPATFAVEIFFGVDPTFWLVGGCMARMDIVGDVESLYRLEFPRLVRALACVYDVDTAAEAVQEAFLEADRHWQRICRYDNPAAWVRRVALNRARNSRRNSRRRSEIVGVVRAIPPDDLTDELLDLRRALATLPERMRLTVCLHYLADLSVHDVAQLLDVAQGTVKSNLHDARNRLRSALVEDPHA